ncbi:MAG: hypothetical protein ACTHME_06510 [Candidatus Nitrosocosmicus sp.]
MFCSYVDEVVVEFEPEVLFEDGLVDDVKVPALEEEGADVALPDVEFDCENAEDVDTDATNIALNIVTVNTIPILIFVLLLLIN